MYIFTCLQSSLLLSKTRAWWQTAEYRILETIPKEQLRKDELAVMKWTSSLLTTLLLSSENFVLNKREIFLFYVYVLPLASEVLTVSVPM